MKSRDETSARLSQTLTSIVQRLDQYEQNVRDANLVAEVIFEAPRASLLRRGPAITTSLRDRKNLEEDLQLWAKRALARGEFVEEPSEEENDLVATQQANNHAQVPQKLHEIVSLVQNFGQRIIDTAHDLEYRRISVEAMRDKLNVELKNLRATSLLHSSAELENAEEGTRETSPPAAASGVERAIESTIVNSLERKISHLEKQNEELRLRLNSKEFPVPLLASGSGQSSGHVDISLPKTCSMGSQTTVDTTAKSVSSDISQVKIEYSHCEAGVAPPCTAQPLAQKSTLPWVHAARTIVLLFRRLRRRNILLKTLLCFYRRKKLTAHCVRSHSQTQTNPQPEFFELEQLKASAKSTILQLARTAESEAKLLVKNVELSKELRLASQMLKNYDLDLPQNAQDVNKSSSSVFGIATVAMELSALAFNMFEILQRAVPRSVDPRFYENLSLQLTHCLGTLSQESHHLLRGVRDALGGMLSECTSARQATVPPKNVLVVPSCAFASLRSSPYYSTLQVPSRSPQDSSQSATLEPRHTPLPSKTPVNVSSSQKSSPCYAVLPTEQFPYTQFQLDIPPEVSTCAPKDSHSPHSSPFSNEVRQSVPPPPPRQRCPFDDLVTCNNSVVSRKSVETQTDSRPFQTLLPRTDGTPRQETASVGIQVGTRSRRELAVKLTEHSERSTMETVGETVEIMCKSNPDPLEMNLLIAEETTPQKKFASQLPQSHTTPKPDGESKFNNEASWEVHVARPVAPKTALLFDMLQVDREHQESLKRFCQLSREVQVAAQESDKGTADVHFPKFLDESPRRAQPIFAHGRKLYRRPASARPLIYSAPYESASVMTPRGVGSFLPSKPNNVRGVAPRRSEPFTVPTPPAPPSN